MHNIMKYLPRLSSYQMIAATFIGLIGVGTLLLMLPIAVAQGGTLSFIDALFTATSASCVTGLIVVDTGTKFSVFGKIVLLFLIQLGGLGIMTFATLFTIAIGHRVNLQERLRVQEALNENEMSSVIEVCIRVVKYTLVIEGVLGTVLAWRFYQDFGLSGIAMGYWHAVSFFCNAGFDLLGNYQSLTGYATDMTINIVVMLLITLGGIGFAVMKDVKDNLSFRKLRVHTKIVLVTSFALTFGGALLVWAMEAGNMATIGHMSTGEQFMASLFQSVSARTAGCNTIALDGMRDSGLFVMILLMFMGASPASTGGGIKTTTVAVIFVSMLNFVRGKEELVVYDRSIDRETIHRCFVIMSLGVLWVCLATLGIAYFENDRFLNMLFEVVSAFATVGLSTGETQHISEASKLVLILTMFFGRIGILTAAMALANRNFKRKIHYPEEKIMIG